MATGSARARKIDDGTVAMVLELHRTKRDDGRRHSYREIAKQCGVSPDAVRRIVQEAHAETVGSATEEIRERIAGALDINVERITGMAEELAEAAREGRWKNGEEIKGMPRVVAAREAVEASYKLVQALGVNTPTDELDPDAVVARARKLYGLDETEDDEEPHAPHEGNGATTH